MNDYIKEGEIAFIILRNKNKNEKGRAIIDIDDLEKCISHTWYLDSTGYARTTIDDKKVRLHKFLTDTDESTLVDHFNRIRLDCRKENLRKGDYDLNASKYKRTNSGYWYARYSSKLYGVKLCKSFKHKDDAIKQRKLWEIKYGGRNG